MSTSILKDIQNQIVALVKAAMPEGVEVIARDCGNIDNDIQASLSKLGIAAVVMEPLARRENASAASSVIVDVETEINLWETPLTNSTGVSLGALFEDVVRACHAKRVRGQTLVLGEVLPGDSETGEKIYSITYQLKNIIL